MRHSKVCLAGMILGMIFAQGSAAAEPAKTWPVAGRVEGPDGKPIAGAQVWIPGFGKSMKRLPPSVITDADGQFQLDSPMQTQGLVLEAKSSDGKRMGYVQLAWELPTDELVDAVKLVLRKPRELTVEVRDGEGKPVAEATVVAVANYRKVDRAASDARGQAKLRIPADAPLEAAVALKPGVGVDYWWFRGAKEPLSDPYKLAADYAGKLEFSLNGIRPVKVRLLDDQGKPMPGQRVRPWLINRPNKGEDLNLSGLEEFNEETDDQGVATFELIPADNSRGVTFWVDAEGFSRKRVEFDPSKDANELVAQLSPLVSVSGVVKHADGSPAAAIRVSVGGAGYTMDRFRESVKSDAEGQFSLQVDPDQYYQFSAGNREWASAAVNQIVLSGRPVEGIAIQLQPAKRVFGRVTIGGDNQPAVGVYTQLYQQPAVDYYDLPEAARLPNPTDSNLAILPRTTWGGPTDKDGRFEYFVGPGKYYVSGPSGIKPVEFELTDQASYEVNLHAERPDKIPLRGRVVLRHDPDQGVAGAIVAGIAKNSRMRDLRATSGEEGRFQTERGSAETVIRAKSLDGKLAGITTIGPDDGEVTLEIAPTTSAHVRLVDEVTSEPLEDRQVDYGVRVEMEGGTSRRGFGGSARTDANGELSIQELVLGQEYELSLVQETSPDGSPRSWSRIGKVTPTSESTVEMGDVIVERPYKEPTTAERVAERFENSQPINSRLAGCLRDASLGCQRVLVLVGSPQNGLIEKIFEADFDGSLDGTTFNYLFLTLDTRSLEQLEEVSALLKTWNISTPEKDEALILVVDPETGLVTHDTSRYLGAESVDGAKLTAFLKNNAAKLPDAEVLYADALAQAARENKRVFVQCSGPRCGWCTVLSRFVDDHRELFEKEFVYLKLDPRLKNGAAVIERVRPTQKGGIPWFVFLDAEGTPLITSDGPSGNTGYPGEPESREHFEKMLRTEPRHLTDADIESLIAALAK
jgi:hypothetical protein